MLWQISYGKHKSCRTCVILHPALDTMYMLHTWALECDLSIHLASLLLNIYEGSGGKGGGSCHYSQVNVDKAWV